MFCLPLRLLASGTATVFVARLPGIESLADGEGGPPVIARVNVGGESYLGVVIPDWRASKLLAAARARHEAEAASASDPGPDDQTREPATDRAAADLGLFATDDEEVPPPPVKRQKQSILDFFLPAARRAAPRGGQ